MDKNGINGAPLSHNRCMESKLQTSGVTLSQKEAEEYCAYKRQKKMNEIMAAMRRAESILTGSEDVTRACERAARLKLGAVQLTPAALEQWGEVVRRRPVKIDCIIGGDGETLAKVKAYEVKKVMRLGAREFTLRVTPSFVATSRYTQLRKEVRRLRKAVGKGILKVRVERILPHATLSRLLRVACESGADYFSFPYFEGCEKLQTELIGGCLLEVSGVNTLPVFQKMAGAGIGRVITSRAWELYCEWAQEAEKVALEGVVALPAAAAPVAAVGAVKTPSPAANAAAASSAKPPVAANAVEKTSLPLAAKTEEKEREKPLLLPSSRVENAV